MTTDRRLIEFVHANRSVVGIALLGLAVACVALAGYAGYRGFVASSQPPPSPAKADPPKAGEKDPKPKEGASTPELDPRPWQMGLGAGLIAALGLGGVGAFFLGKLPPADPDERRRTDRVLILVAGYVFGLANRVSGLFLFILWFDKLVGWVNREPGSHQTGWLPLAALLQYLVGAGVTFLAVLPARAEERNRPWIRRAVYAVNFALTTVLLVVGLVVANVAVSLRLSDPLDTSAGEFYTLSEPTRNYLKGLKRKVKVVVVSSEAGDPQVRRPQADAARLLTAMRQVNPAQVEVEHLSAVHDPRKLDDLRRKHPQAAADLRGLGVFITTDEHPERHVFADFATMSQRNQEGGAVFVGEAQLVRGMMQLTETKAVAYFTQSSREPAVARPTDPAAPANPRTARTLVEGLTQSECEVKPLVFDPQDEDPSVPPDADLVVVLDPLAPLPEKAVAAVRKYLSPPDPKAKKGRLLVFAGAHNTTGGATVFKTGLEPLLAGYGIDLTDRAVYSQPPIQLPPGVSLVVPPDDPKESKRAAQNPFTASAANGLVARTPRLVRAGGGSQPAVQVYTERLSWLEPGVADPPQAALAALAAAERRRDQKYFEERDVTFGVGANRTVGAYATHPDGQPAVAVFGFATGLTDDPKDFDGGGNARLFETGLNWLRERPDAPDIGAISNLTYTPPRRVNGDLLFTVPVLGTLLAVVMLGLGVWSVRRK